MIAPPSLRLSRWTRLYWGLGIGSVVSLLIIMMWASNLFVQLRLRLNNVYFVPETVSNTIVIVAIDDASLDVYGRSPGDWSRAIYADVMRQLSTVNARVVAFDMLFDIASDNDEVFALGLQEARQSEARTRIVLAAAGSELSLAAQEDGEQALYFADALLPTPALREVVDNIGYVNVYPDVDGAIRRQPSLIYLDGTEQFNVSFPLAVYLTYLRVPAIAFPQIVVSEPHALQVTSARTLTVDTNGLWLQNFFGPPSEGIFPVVSLLDVANGNFAPEMFENKIVLIGMMNNTGATDQYNVPSDINGQLMAGVEIHANAIETFIQDRFLHEQSPISQVATIALLAFVTSLVYMQLRWLWTFPLALMLMVGWLLFAFVHFSATREMLNLFHPVLAILMPVIANAALKVAIEVTRRLRAEFLLNSVVEISNQRLSIDRITARLGADIQRALQSPSGIIWLLRDDQPEIAHRWGINIHDIPAFTALCTRAEVNKNSVVDQSQIAVPVLWRQRVIGVFTVQLPDQRSVRTSLNLLEELARQIAPSLENATLYAEVEHQRSLLEAILAGSPVGIMVLDNELRVLRKNAVLVEALEITDTCDTLTQALHAIPEESRAPLVQRFNTQQPFRQEIKISIRTFNLEAAPLPELKQWVVTLHNVTPLVELSGLKTRMIRMASHDLKNPLSRVLGYGTMMLELDENDSQISPSHKRFITAMVHSANEMNNIINDILNLEQLRSGEFKREPVNLRAIVYEVVGLHQFDLTTRQLALRSEIADNVAPVMGNYRQLLQMTSNLLGNAIKYTPEGGKIMIRLYPTENHHIRLEVEDTGFGIPEESKDKLFTEFFRVRTDATLKIAGTGLGLSLVKTTAEAYQGRVWFTSEENVGSTFFVELPTIRETL